MSEAEDLRDDALSKLYRRSSTEAPSGQVDQLILNAARRAVASEQTMQKPKARLRLDESLIWPVAASVVLAISVYLLQTLSDAPQVAAITPASKEKPGELTQNLIALNEPAMPPAAMKNVERQEGSVGNDNKDFVTPSPEQGQASGSIALDKDIEARHPRVSGLTNRSESDSKSATAAAPPVDTVSPVSKENSDETKQTIIALNETAMPSVASKEIAGKAGAVSEDKRSVASPALEQAPRSEVIALNKNIEARDQANARMKRADELAPMKEEQGKAKAKSDRQAERIADLQASFAAESPAQPARMAVAAAKAPSQISIIQSVRTIPASRFEPSLPSMPVGEWIERNVAARYTVVWDDMVTDCGEGAGSPADQSRDMPICVQVVISRDATRRAVVEFVVGTSKTGAKTDGTKLHSIINIKDGRTVVMSSLTELHIELHQ